ncbi:MAG: M20/M25/M40 family metallo-hydrolase [Phycisphaerae bacterium]|jgi:endoglucanase
MARTTQRSINRRILKELARIPTAPFAEHRVIEFVRRFCRSRRGVTLRTDAVGNMLARVRKGTRRVAKPVCITAHLDHPGFVAEKMTSKTRLRAKWRGGVPPEYFVGSPVRFFFENTSVRGRVRSVKTVTKGGRKVVDTAAVDVSGQVPSGSMGVWDLPAPRVKGARFHAPVCDDFAGVAAMLGAIDELSKSTRACDAYFLFTRAEEVGFAGAMAACRLKTIPQKCLVIAMETSSELPHAKMGDGPILRVGDRATTYFSAATAHCQHVADDLVKSDKRFKVQRRLMDGGMCEASAYCIFGYEATGMCLALGNYHNCDKKRTKIAHEYIDLTDYDNVIKWFVALARTRRTYTGRDDALQKRLRGIETEYDALLHASSDRPH